MKGAAYSAGALAVCSAAGGGLYFTGALGKLFRQFLDWWNRLVDGAVDAGKQLIQSGLAAALQALASLGLGGLIAPVTAWLASNVEGMADWLKRTGALGSMLLALFAGMLILRVRA